MDGRWAEAGGLKTAARISPGSRPVFATANRQGRSGSGWPHFLFELSCQRFCCFLGVGLRCENLEFNKRYVQTRAVQEAMTGHDLAELLYVPWARVPAPWFSLLLLFPSPFFSIPLPFSPVFFDSFPLFSKEGPLIWTTATSRHTPASRRTGVKSISQQCFCATSQFSAVKPGTNCQQALHLQQAVSRTSAVHAPEAGRGDRTFPVYE